MMSTRPEAANCTACHLAQDRTQLAHASIGGGDCATCHPPQGARMSPVFYGSPQAPARKAWFPHSTPLHSALTCIACHGEDIGYDDQIFSAWHAFTGKAHRGTAESEISCSACHIEHEGKVHLVEVEDHLCTDCHGDLEDTLGQTSFEIVGSAGPPPPWPPP